MSLLIASPDPTPQIYHTGTVRTYAGTVLAQQFSKKNLLSAMESISHFVFLREAQKIFSHRISRFALTVAQEFHHRFRTSQTQGPKFFLTNSHFAPGFAHLDFATNQYSTQVYASARPLRGPVGPWARTLCWRKGGQRTEISHSGYRPIYGCVPHILYITWPFPWGSGSDPARAALQNCVICRTAMASAAQQPLLWKEKTESGPVLWNYYYI